jgi:pimeloyl-ACP methyl ester carboxylesterase
MILTVLFLSLSLVLVLVLCSANTIIAYGLSSISSNVNSNNIIISNPKILDPNPGLIDGNGKLKKDTSLVANTDAVRLGTIADGVSKLLLVIDSDKSLQLSVDGTTRDNLTKGALKEFNRSSNEIGPSYSNVIVHPQNISKNRNVVVAVYTPPDHIDLQGNASHTTIHILVNGTSDPRLSINLYRVPIVLVHGIWVNSSLTWKLTNFNNTLYNNGFNYTFADYGKHNATTFDPYANSTIGKYHVKAGNYGIEAIRDKIYGVLKDFHNKSIAASQVDIIAHSMGGLMARGFTQQPDYYNKTNYMKGYIHRLITIGTPHFGAPLSEFLFFHRNDQYCFNPYTNKIIPSTFCLFDPLHFQSFPLKVIYAEKLNPKLHSSIDKGGIEALSPRSVAYSDLCKTNVTSYAIAGSWKSNGIFSHDTIEDLYKIILGNPFFDLERNGFHGDNDLQVNITSQLGGIHGHLMPQSMMTNNHTMPNGAAIYNNTIHGSIFRDKHDLFVSSEIGSAIIQQDVVRLLNSPDNKFANSIGIGSPCHKPGNP